MERITRESDGSYHWDCSIDKEYHQESGWQGLWAVLFICIFVFIVFLIISHGTITRGDLWIPLVVIGVILTISLPLIFLWYSAPDPHEQYVLTEDHVKSGYGKDAIYSEFHKTREVVITAKYIEMIGKYRNNRIHKCTFKYIISKMIYFAHILFHVILSK